MGKGSWARGVVGIGLLALAAVACGGDDDDGAASGSSSSGSGSGAAITIEHRYGSTSLDAPPERIVSLDTQWTDVLTALDAPLVGAGLFTESGGEPYPWQEIPDDVELIPLSASSFPDEQLAELEPDLIVVTYAAVDEVDYDRLREIAPTIPLLGEGDVDPWEDIAVAAGTVLGEPEAAAQLVADAQQQTDALVTELPGLQGKTFAFANYVPGDALYVLTDPEDGANTFFAELGLQIEPNLLVAGDDTTGRLELSLERVDMLAADVVMLLTNGADPASIPGYASLPAVQNGSAVVVDMATAVGLNTPTPLSLPYALDQIRPALDSAAAAAG